MATKFVCCRGSNIDCGNFGYIITVRCAKNDESAFMVG